MKKLLFILVTALVVVSCSNVFNAIVVPNQCKRCQVVDSYSKEVLFENEGCGGANVRLEEEAKVAAYDQSRNGSLCDLEVSCETWRQESEEEGR